MEDHGERASCHVPHTIAHRHDTWNIDMIPIPEHRNRTALAGTATGSKAIDSRMAKMQLGVGAKTTKPIP